ncbi:MAG: hypothetical protein A3B75_01460 [Candidatus Terrybacteria bacterium RIFCSPHIGHO2_02_FULL_43_14]|nr:MAG: hypothetical protein A3B75_01460 [Candidatus Terrybacteria bacterium RIFCSPHIGHO2_02_FULL_43_14]
MDFALTEEQKMLKDATLEFMADKRVQEWIAVAEKTKGYPHDFMKVAAAMGYLGMNVDTKYGGAGMSYLDAVIAIEQIAYSSASFSLNILVQNSLFGFAIAHAGTEAQKKKYLDAAARGDLFGCFANTEPDVGSDAKNIRTTAVKKGDRWIINGTKRFCTSAAVSSAAVIFARTSPRAPGSPGITAFLIDIGPNVKGYTLDRVEKKNAQPGTLLCEFTLKDYEAAEDAVLGTPEKGWDVCDATFRHSRVWIAAQGVGLAQRAFDETVAYTSTRKTFGKRIIEREDVGSELARLKIEIESARLLTYKAAWQETIGDQDFALTSSMAKYAAGEAAQKAALRCYRYFGGLSAVVETISAKLLLDALIIPVYEGPSEIQLAIISKHISQSVRA